MNTRAPNRRQIGVAATFTFVCLGLLTYLWLSFGGAVPLKPAGYRFAVAFPEVGQLTDNADVRISGINAGKVKGARLDPAGNRVLATIEMDRRFAPIPRDTRAILRLRTLEGETYVQLTPGDRRSGALPDGGRLPDGQVQRAVALDEFLGALDPTTRASFRGFLSDSATAMRGRDQDLNDVTGDLAPFARSGADLLATLDLQDRAVSALVRSTGRVAGAVSAHTADLQDLVRSGDAVFAALAARSDALARTVALLPGFLADTRATLARLRRFSRGATPVVNELVPAARQLAPTVHSIRELSPGLRRLFDQLGPMITAARAGLPATQATLERVRPLMRGLGAFLEQLNPALGWLGLYQYQAADFLAEIPSQLAAVEPSPPSTNPTHVARGTDVEGLEGVALWPYRLPSNRGNAYLPPLGEYPKASRLGIFPNFDCRPSGGEAPADPNPGGGPACFTASPLTVDGRRQGAYPHVRARDYRRP